MKIFYISSSRIPSTEANSFHVMKMCEAFYETGHDITLIAPKLISQKIPEDPESLAIHYGLKKLFKLKYIFSCPGLLGRDYCIRAAWKAKINNTDLVYSRYILAAAWCARFKMRVILEAHDIPEEPFKLYYFEKFIESRNFIKLVVISSKLKELFLEKFGSKLDEKKILIAHDAVDLERFQNLPEMAEIRNTIGISSSKFTLGYAGNLYEGRGIELLFELAGRFSDYQFIIIGGGALLEKYKTEAVLKNLKNIKFYGFIPNSAIPQYLAACDVLLMPYQKKLGVSKGNLDTARFMSPMKMFEYMASGRFIVASDLPVLREVLNQNNSYLCDPENIDDWKLGVNKAAEDPFFRKKIGDMAFEDVKQYTWKKRIHTVLENLR